MTASSFTATEKGKEPQSHLTLPTSDDDNGGTIHKRTWLSIDLRREREGSVSQSGEREREGERGEREREREGEREKREARGNA